MPHPRQLSALAWPAGWRRLLVLAWLLAGLPAAAAVVSNLVIEGNHRIPETEIRQLLQTRTGRPFVAGVWEAERDRLLATGLFQDVYPAPPIVSAGRVRLRLEVIERPLLGAIRFQGNTAVSSADLQDLMLSKVGDTFNSRVLMGDLRHLEENYRLLSGAPVTLTHRIIPEGFYTQVFRGRLRRLVRVVAVEIKVTESPPVILDRVIFIGNEQVAEENLRELVKVSRWRALLALATRPQAMQAELERYKRRLEEYYRRQGFLDMRVTRVGLEPLPGTVLPDLTGGDHPRVEVAFYLFEGRRHHLRRLEISGNELVSLPRLMELMRSRQGDHFSDLTLADDLDRIRAEYAKLGRPFTLVQAEVDRQLPPRRRRTNLRHHVEIRIKEMPVVHLRDTRFVGLKEVPPAILRAPLALTPGTVLTSDVLAQARRRLLRLGLFSELHLRPVPAKDPHLADLDIIATEAIDRSLNFGLGYSNVDTIVATAGVRLQLFDWQDWPESWHEFVHGDSFRGGRQTVDAELRLSPYHQRLQAGFTEPWLFDRPWHFEAQAFWDTARYHEAFAVEELGTRLALGIPIGVPWETGAAWRLTMTRVKDTDDGAPLVLQEQEGTYLLSAFAPYVQYEQAPWTTRFTLEVGGAGGDLEWLRPELTATRHTLLGSRFFDRPHRLTLRSSLTAIAGWDLGDDAPPFLRLYAGGIGSLRGFESMSATPRVNGYAVGAQCRWLASADYEIPLGETPLHLVGFTDAAWLDGPPDRLAPGDEVTGEGLRTSAGVGLVWRRGNRAPFRLYYGKPIRQEREDDRQSVQLELVMGF